MEPLVGRGQRNFLVRSCILRMSVLCPVHMAGMVAHRTFPTLKWVKPFQNGSYCEARSLQWRHYRRRYILVLCRLSCQSWDILDIRGSIVESGTHCGQGSSLGIRAFQLYTRRMALRDNLSVVLDPSLQRGPPHGHTPHQRETPWNDIPVWRACCIRDSEANKYSWPLLLLAEWIANLLLYLHIQEQSLCH